MIRGILGALIGSEFDRRDGKGGLKGAVIGTIASRMIPRLGPFGFAIGGAYVAKKAYDRHRAAKTTV